ncbi:MAG TPA: hypothetical protein VN442_25705 [Bryobacteraceae bacterium]|nr:hypothetical protein [Bryobacteraceae bacterium]
MRRYAAPLLFLVVAFCSFNAGRHAFAGSFGRAAIWGVLGMLWMYVALRIASARRRPR